VFCAEIVVSGCYTTLDPAPLNGTEDEGVLPTCSFADSDAARYVVCSEQLPYVDAQADCEKRGARLAAIASQEENDFIGMRVSAVVSANVWLGGMRADDLVWSWPNGSVFWRGAVDGSLEPGAFARWQPGEPNDSSTVTTDPERCLVLVGGDYAWNDRSCSLALPYVCEQAL
jgi:hypothetical protein